MSIQYNALKSMVKDFYEFSKDQYSYNEALERALDFALESRKIEDFIHPNRNFATIFELRSFLVSEIQYEVNINQNVEAGHFHTLNETTGHISWYREKVSSESIDFVFFDRYKKYLLNVKGWKKEVVDKLDEITDNILDLIENPDILNRPFDRRGLVVGYVQSGKTANFTGVINKALDSGYKVVIVLSGMHKNLRSQTQMRIDEEVIGRDTSFTSEKKQIGVATLISKKVTKRLDVFTTQDDNGDFSIGTVKKAGGIQPGPDRQMIFVVKKNVSVLRNLAKYFTDCLKTLPKEFILIKEDGKAVLNNLPLLLIDDEADQATPNLNSTDEEDLELDPTKINMQIRRLLNIFNQKAYIGYTATPFANIFIHPENVHSELGKDLFPASFIISMDAPSNYFGPVKVFGINNSLTNDGLPINILVTDVSQKESLFLPLKHKPSDVPDHIPESMKEALKAFIISSAIRRIRGQGNKHNTMLIHCTRFNAIQAKIGILVGEEFSVLREAIINEDVEMIFELETLFQRDYKRISNKMLVNLCTWAEVKENLKASVLKMERRPHIINGSAGDILDYKNREQDGLSVIIIGGDKLSRGLTLYGLTVSYFTRTSTLYDTLMQMGRWFGFRDGYEDLCRLYTTNDLFVWYRHISTAFEKLRDEFLEMSRQKSTPVEFGLRVLSHPDMMVTNALKMRYSKKMPLCYTGHLTETSTLSAEPSILVNNYTSVLEFIRSISKYEVTSKFDSSYLWLKIPRAEIVKFLAEYISFRGAPSSNTKRIVEFINEQYIGTVTNDVLSYWNVSLASLKRRSSDIGLISIAGFKIKPLSRGLKDPLLNDRLFLKRIVSNEDEKIDFDFDTELTGDELRKLNPRLNRALLTIYPLNITELDHPEISLTNLEAMPFGFGISWPNNSKLKQSTYDINNVYDSMEQ